MEHVICYKYVLYIVGAFLDLFPEDIKLLTQLFQLRLVIFGDREPQDAGFHHFPQLHQVHVVLTLMKNNAVHHRVDHDLIESVAYKCTLCSPDLKYAVIDKNLDRLSDGIAAYSEAFGQFHFGRNLIAGLEVSGDDHLCDTVYHSLNN